MNDCYLIMLDIYEKHVVMSPGFQNLGFRFSPDMINSKSSTVHQQEDERLEKHTHFSSTQDRILLTLGQEVKFMAGNIKFD